MQPLHPAQSVANLSPKLEALAEIMKVVIPAYSAGLLSKYFLISSTSVDYYVWLDNAANDGTDPMVASRTGIEVTAQGTETAAELAALYKTALEGVGFLVSRESATLQVTNAATGVATDAGADDSGFTVTKMQDGQAVKFGPGMAVSAISINPSTY